MVTLKVNTALRDVVEHVDRKVGDTFDVTEARAAHIESILPGYMTRKAVSDDEVLADKKPAPKRRATRKAE